MTVTIGEMTDEMTVVKIRLKIGDAAVARGTASMYQQWTHDDNRQGERRQSNSWGQQCGPTGGNQRKDDRR